LRTTYIQISYRDSYTEICLSIYICRYTNTYCFQDGVRRDWSGMFTKIQNQTVKYFLVNNNRIRNLSTIFGEAERFCFCFSKKRLRKGKGGNNVMTWRTWAEFWSWYKKKIKTSYFWGNNHRIRDVRGLIGVSIARGDGKFVLLQLAF